MPLLSNEQTAQKLRNYPKAQKMKSLEIGSHAWWAMTGSNCRPSRCKRLTNQQVIDLSSCRRHEKSVLYNRLRKTAQELKRILREKRVLC